MRHLGVSVCIVKVIGGYGYGTQNCDCVDPLHGHGNPLQQVVVRQRISSLEGRSGPLAQMLRLCQLPPEQKDGSTADWHTSPSS